MRFRPNCFSIPSAKAQGLAAVLSILALSPALSAASSPLTKVLVYNKAGWYVHPDIPLIDAHLKKMGADNGYQVDISSNPADFNAAKLAGYQVVVLNNISEMGTSVKETAQRNAFRQWVEGGGGVVAFHGSGVVRGTWDWYISLLGTDWYYDAAMQEARVFIPPEARSLPISSGVPLEGRLTDEWNNFKVNVDTLAGFTVALAIDETSYDPTRKKNASEGNGIPGFRMADAGGRWVHPVSWTRMAGKGRVFYSCIGHDIKVMGTPFATLHFLRAIQWAGGALEGPSGLGEILAAGDNGMGRGWRMEAGRIEFPRGKAYALDVYSMKGTRVFSASGTSASGTSASGTGPARHPLGEILPPGIYRIRTISGFGLPSTETLVLF